AWFERKPSAGFWYALRVAQATVLLQAFLGLLLVFTGHHASELHILYGVLPLVVSLLAEVVRLGSPSAELGDLRLHSLAPHTPPLPPEPPTRMAMPTARRATGIMAPACLLIFLLALRAAGTSSAF